MRILETEMTENEYLTYFTLIYQTTNFTKLQEFQYKILTNSVITNVNLKKWGIINTESCSFCENEPESLTHLLLNCPVSKNIWNYLLRKIARITDTTIHYYHKEMLLGITNDIPENNILNSIFLATKYYLYTSRCLKIRPVGDSLLQKIRNLRDIEQMIASNNDRIHAHTKKWHILTNL